MTRPVPANCGWPPVSGRKTWIGCEVGGSTTRPNESLGGLEFQQAELCVARFELFLGRQVAAVGALSRCQHRRGDRGSYCEPRLMKGERHDGKH
jgi:hypothetical protein